LHENATTWCSWQVLHADPHHLQEVGDLVGREARQGVEERLAIGHGCKNSVDENGVQVRRKLEVGGIPLHHHDRPAATVADAFVTHATPVPAENRVHEDPADGAESLAVIGQAPASQQAEARPHRA
jgi:hypothetical protein